VYPGNETAASKELRPHLQDLLDEQRKLKCLTPRVNEGELRDGGEGLIDFEMPELRQMPNTSMVDQPPAS